MIKTISNFGNISVIDQNQTDNIYDLQDISYNDQSIGSGGFGSVYKVNRLNNKATKSFVIKIFDQTESQEHAYSSISLLHNKIKKRQRKTGVPIFHEYPELIGLPFIAFNAYDDIDEKDIIGFLMYDLSNLGYEDYGTDIDSNILQGEEIQDRLYYSFQLSKAISFLHDNKFIHADISENAIWINKKTKKLALIDYDSGFHYDKQEKPTTIGKITQWIGGGIRNIIGNKQDTDRISIRERIAEENWILANANFELLTGLQPYFFLVDADDNTKKAYLKKYTWPNVDNNCDVYNENNHAHHQYIIQFISQLEKFGLNELTSAFKEIFNKGYSKDSKRLTTTEWKEQLSSICSQLDFSPKINSYTSDKVLINEKGEIVNFEWDVLYSNSISINGNPVPLFHSTRKLAFDNDKVVTLNVKNDFGECAKEINIKANKVKPNIISFEASTYLRNSLDPVKLHWKVNDALKVKVSHLEKDFETIDGVEVKPSKDTLYQITAIGNFDDISTAELKVSIAKPQIELFAWEVNLEHGLDNIDIKWETSNTENVIIEPKIGTRKPSGIEHVGISEATEFKITAKGLFSSIEKTIKAHPFPVPIIESVFTEAPKIELNYSFNSEDLKIPREIVDTGQINFNSNINIKNLVDFNQSIQLEEVEHFNTKPIFVENNKLIELYNKERVSTGKIFNQIKNIISKKLNRYENKR